MNNQLTWAAARIEGVTTLVQRDRAAGTAVIVELADGVVRIRTGEVRGRRFIVRQDATLETVCALEASETLPIFEDEPARRPGLARAVVAEHLAASVTEAA